MRERDCPISEKYGPRLALLEKDYSKKGIQFIFVYVGQLRSDQNAKKDLEKFKFKSPYIVDKNQKIIEALGAKTTGDVFILNPEFKTIYRGPVDDQFHLLKSALRAKNHYVRDVLEKLLSGEKVIPKERPAPGCIISKPFKKKVYFKDVAPIFNAKCLNCHSGGKTLIEFKDYESLYGRRAMIKYVIENKLMPPWSLSEHTGPWIDNPSLSSKEKQMLLKWLYEGLPYKNKSIKLFSPYKKETIKNPDHVIKLDKPIEVPATGFLPYQRIISVPNFSESKYIKEIEFLPKPKVVHHLLITVLDSSYLPELKKLPSYSLHKAGKLIKGWTIGKEPTVDYKNVGVEIPKNSVLLVYIHYDPIGRKLIDTETQVKFKFHLKPPKYSLSLVRLSDKKLEIPAYHSNYMSKIYYKLKRELFLYSVGVHMHLRGKSSSISIQDLGGNETTIFKLDPYLFNFQRGFLLKFPLKIPKDHTIICRNYFDNSINNPVNPDPSKNVKRGINTQDEMSECYLAFLTPNF